MTTIQISQELKKQLDVVGGKMQSKDGVRRTYAEIVKELLHCWTEKN